MRVGTTVTSSLRARVIDPRSGQSHSLPPQPVPFLDALWVYDLTTGQALPQRFLIPKPKSNSPSLNPVDGLLFSPDGSRILVRPARPTIYTAGKYELPPAYLLDAESLQPAIAPLQITRTSGVGPQVTESLHSVNPIESLAAFSPDGGRVAFADGGNLVGVFETGTGQALRSALSHPGRVLWVWPDSGTRQPAIQSARRCSIRA
jgi:hypothetical protein